MAEAVEQRCRQLLVAEDLDPLGECELGGDDLGTPLPAVGEQSEKQFAAGPVKGHEDKIVGDQ